jgi:hypothetical protein
MNLIWSTHFTDALARLTPQEQKQAKLTADLLLDPKGNGLSLHRVEAAQGFWTARVSQDLRIVLHKDGAHTLLAWVGHHDDAYRWAERRRRCCTNGPGRCSWWKSWSGWKSARPPAQQTG